MGDASKLCRCLKRVDLGLPTYRPTSKAGEARGESSAVMVNRPSNLRSGLGEAKVADILVRTLHRN